MITTIKLIILVIAINVTLIPIIEGKILSQCEAARQLELASVDRTFISTYVCIMKSESGFNTSKKSGPGHKASYSYGIFQISSDKWCSAFRKGGICKANCNDFLDDDIRDDIMCAKRIANAEGFKHWKGWVKSCKNLGQLPNVAPCLRRKRSLVDGDELVKYDDDDDYVEYDVIL